MSVDARHIVGASADYLDADEAALVARLNGGEVRRPCCRCGKETLLSPAGWAQVVVMAARNAQLLVVCFRCAYPGGVREAMRAVAAGEAALAPGQEAQARRIVAALGVHRRRRN